MLMALLMPAALAQPPVLDPIVRGEDLVAWRALGEAPTPEALLEFIETWPQSILTELAWRSLVNLGTELPDNPPYSKIALSVQHHQENLERLRHDQVIANLPTKSTAE